MYDLKKYRPIQLNDLVRLGRNYDGGYIVSTKQTEKTSILLSFGVNDDWSFESDFLTKKQVKIYAYDYSVSRKFQNEKIRDYIGCMLGSFLVLRRSKVREYWRNIKALKQNTKEIYKYFKPDQNRFFIPKYLGETDDEIYITFKNIFDSFSVLENYSVFVKMDIEGAEYKTLPQLKPYFDKINGIVVEFHGLKEPQEFEELMTMFSENFYIAHVHANSSLGCINNTNLPNLLEITFINKFLVKEPIELSTRKYPIEGLDFSNRKDEDEIKLDF